MEIMIETTNICNLNCKFCAYDLINNDPTIMSLKRFKYIVKKMIDYGFDEFQLTPTVGESFSDPSFLDKIEWLEQLDDVKRITFFTNFTGVTKKNILRLMKTRKTVMFISVYGWDNETFNNITNTNKFDKFQKSFNLLLKNYDIKFRSLNFFIRNPKWNSINKSLDMYKKINLLVKIKNNGTSFFDRNNIQEHLWNGNWCGLIKDNMLYDQVKVKDRSGVCWFSLIDNIVDNFGNVYLCGACDSIKETKLGNIENLDLIYSTNGALEKIIKEQHKGTYSGCCNKCSEFHKVPLNFLETLKYKWIKNYE